MPVSQQHGGDGLITNDKFCLVRRTCLQLSWSRLPWSLRVARVTEERSAESLRQGGNDATSVDRTPQRTTSEQSRRKEKPAPLLLRIPPDILNQVDTAVEARPLKTPRHTWILEAILEKLRREDGAIEYVLGLQRGEHQTEGSVAEVGISLSRRVHHYRLDPAYRAGIERSPSAPSSVKHNFKRYLSCLRVSSYVLQADLRTCLVRK